MTLVAVRLTYQSLNLGDGVFEVFATAEITNLVETTLTMLSLIT